jgi:hypothetical protein
MFFESANFPFSIIASMKMWREKLILRVIGCEKVFKSRKGLVVHGLKFGFETLGS